MGMWAYVCLSLCLSVSLSLYVLLYVLSALVTHTHHTRHDHHHTHPLSLPSLFHYHSISPSLSSFFVISMKDGWVFVQSAMAGIDPHTVSLSLPPPPPHTHHHSFPLIFSVMSVVSFVLCRVVHI